MIEALMQARKDKYTGKDNPILPDSEGLDLVEEDEQIIHQIYLDEERETQFLIGQTTVGIEC